MHRSVTILVVEDDDGHAGLIRKNLKRAGFVNRIIRFKDGEEILNFLLRQGDGDHREPNTEYIMLLDIRMPRIDGIGVLKKVKADPALQKLPITMLTTTDDPHEISQCHELGCNNYITKPIDYDSFIAAIRQLGLFLSVVTVPTIE